MANKLASPRYHEYAAASHEAAARHHLAATYLEEHGEPGQAKAHTDAALRYADRAYQHSCGNH